MLKTKDKEDCGSPPGDLHVAKKKNHESKKLYLNLEIAGIRIRRENILEE